MALVQKIRQRPYAVTDQDLDAVRPRYTEDQLFEIIVAAAFGAANDQIAAAHRGAGGRMRLGNVERGDRLSARLLYGSCAPSPDSGLLMWSERCGTGRISLAGRIPRTRMPSCAVPPNGRLASASCSPHSCRT